MAIASVQGMQIDTPAWNLRRDVSRETNESDVAIDPWNGLAGADETTFSSEALSGRNEGAREADTTSSEDDPEAGNAGPSPDAEGELTTAERQEVDKLKQRDAEVRAHEAAHMAAGGSHVRGGATYSYQQGPDGRSYAIGGEVGIDVSPVSGNPQATIQKMQQVSAAALAPAEPSGADRGVAARAAQHEAAAREQLASQKNGYAAAHYADAAGDQAALPGRTFDAVA